jgi:probable rRNA maturation factor
VELNQNYLKIFEDSLRVVESLSEPEFRATEVSLVIVDSQTIQNLNKQYRQKDQITDVLSFPNWSDKSELFEGYLLGEVFICLPQVRKQAKELNHSLGYELAVLWIHGLWHLHGYDHITDLEYQEMQPKEKKTLEMVFLRFYIF